MKNLLVITLLFSTTAFTKINLICDKSYYFFPDLEKRVLLSFDTTVNEVSRISLSDNLMEVLDWRYDFVVTDEYYKFYYYKTEYLFSVNRTTLEFIDDFLPLVTRIYKCKKIDDIKYQDAKKELKDYSQKFKDKRKI